MGNEPKIRQKKSPTILVALLPIVFLVAVLYVFVVRLDQAVQIPLVMSCAVAAILAVVFTGISWKDLEEGILKTINMGMQAMIILMIIGMLIGTWLVSGIVPSLIYYGLKIIAPAIFLSTAMIICSVVSLATGSSWTTAGTVGVALIGVGQGLGFSVPMVAGAIISGAYFGDKMSPLSDTTNLAPAMAGATLFDHVKHMIWTTGPSYIIAFTIFTIIGIFRTGDNFDPARITMILDVLQSSFTISPLMLIPPLLVIVMVIFKVPAIPGLLGGCALGVIFALLIQGASFANIADIAQNGYSISFGENPTEAQIMISELLNRGGMQSMMSTISLIICALTFGGIMEASGMLEVLARGLLKLAVNTGSLVTITVVSCIFVNIVAADQYLAIVLPGRMYKDAFAKRRLAPKNLSRTLEDAGTMTSALVPWNTCGASMSKFLDVPTLAYLPWCFLNLVNPLVSIAMAFLGFKQTKMTDEEWAAYQASQVSA